ncbi:MAG: HlyD family efflux transporter periplasmic adaptor subunit, partial [Myxococcaceae bacterium]|nr:HlyD family efflux transporter periplasmic adaptor subunit [Myxococcaceae bacterium]
GTQRNGVVVTSPIEGTVLKVIQESESPVLPGAPLLELGDLQVLEVVADLLTRDAARLRPGMPALLEEWGGEPPLPARVRKIEPSATTILSPLGVREQRVNVVLDLLPRDEPVRLGDGFAAQVRFIVYEADDVLKVPRSALFRRGNGWAVFTEVSGHARLAAVKLGQQGSTEAEVLEGLEVGTRVILHPAEAVREGVKVKAASAAEVEPGAPGSGGRGGGEPRALRSGDVAPNRGLAAHRMRGER